MRVVVLLLVAFSLVGCELPTANEVRETFGAKAEANEEGKSLGDVTSDTAGDAKEGIDEKIDEMQASDDDADDAEQ